MLVAREAVAAHLVSVTFGGPALDGLDPGLPAASVRVLRPAGRRARAPDLERQRVPAARRRPIGPECAYLRVGCDPRPHRARRRSRAARRRTPVGVGRDGPALRHGRGGLRHRARLHGRPVRYSITCWPATRQHCHRDVLLEALPPTAMRHRARTSHPNRRPIRALRAPRRHRRLARPPPVGAPPGAALEAAVATADIDPAARGVGRGRGGRRPAHPQAPLRRAWSRPLPVHGPRLLEARPRWERRPRLRPALGLAAQSDLSRRRRSHSDGTTQSATAPSQTKASRQMISVRFGTIAAPVFGA